MTTLPSTPPAPTVHITWAVVEDGFHVGSRAGEFVGFVDRQKKSGLFRACNAFSQPIGDFDDLQAAMRAVADQHGIEQSGRDA